MLTTILLYYTNFEKRIVYIRPYQRTPVKDNNSEKQWNHNKLTMTTKRMQVVALKRRVVIAEMRQAQETGRRPNIK